MADRDARGDARAEARADARARHEARVATLAGRFSDAFARHVRATPGQEFTVLALSGGGQWGAFGAGFLNGWSLRDLPPRRPAFNVVTGTSTGALIATFAFLGPAQDAAVRDAYLSIRGDGDVFSRRLPPEYVWSDSATTRDQFRRRLETLITAPLVQAVARQAEDGRYLFVGATDLLTGEFHPINLTEIAGGGDSDRARQTYIDVLMASTAIPVQFPPVTLTGADPAQPGRTITYVDGGVRRNIFAEAFARAAAAMGQGKPAASIYCLIDGARDVDPIAPIGGVGRLLKIARRSVDVLLNESTEGNLFRIALQMQGQGIRFFVTSVPAQTATGCQLTAANQDQDFDPKLMQCLYDAGVTLARTDPAPWQTDPLAGSP